jgi:uncharacterized membrane protein
MSTIEESIEVQVPVRTAYNQWTQFEEFPRFMEGVAEVRQIDDTHLRWKAEVAGQEREWEAEITEQHPDERVAWKSTGGTQHAGVVTFHRTGADESRVMLQMDVEPEGLQGADRRARPGDRRVARRRPAGRDELTRPIRIGEGPPRRGARPFAFAA